MTRVDAEHEDPAIGAFLSLLAGDIEAGKPTVRLENVLRVIDALGGEIQLKGLPSPIIDDHRNRWSQSSEYAAEHEPCVDDCPREPEKCA